MSFYIDSIHPRFHINSHHHPSETLKNVSSWFLNETIEIDFGDSVGRPTDSILLQREYITQFLQNGWTIDAVMNPNENGRWEKVSSGKSSSDVHRDHDWEADSDGGSYLHQHDRTDNTSESSESGSPYWYAKQRVRLKRRRMQPEKVMQSMLDSYTKAYNTGKSIDDDRFDELMSLYSTVLYHNEKEGRSLLVNAIDPSAFLEKLYNSTWSSFGSAQSSAEKVAETTSDAAVADINRQFDTLLSQRKAEMITNGLFNNTVWPSVSAGIERERAAAIVKAKSEGSQVAASALSSIGSAKASAASAFVAAKQAIADSLDKRRITVMEMRNNVVKWILDFVGSREEVYPELEEISGIAERLGFSVGSAGNVL